MTAEVVVIRDAGLLAHVIAARTITALIDAQARTGTAHLVITGGGLGIACLAAIAQSPARDGVDWSSVHVWWGDERFLPAGHPDRNASQAWAALLDHVPVLPERVHEMAPSDGPFGDDVDAAAAAYAAELAAYAAPGGASAAPAFDVLMLGVGPDGHVASLFPDHPGLSVEGLTALGVRNSPKPPPVRITMSLQTIACAQEVWLVAAGSAKAEAIARAMSGDSALPAARPAGRRGTVWLLDAEAAARLSG